MKAYFRNFQLYFYLYRFYRNFYRFYDRLFYRILPDKYAVKRRFKKTLGYELNLDSPRTLNEKINWLNLYSRNPLRKIVSDKYTAREYISKTVGEQYLVPLVYRTENAADIKPENLPDYPVIIKCNHNSGGVVIVRDKSKIDWEDVQRHFERLLKQNYYYKYRERQYKDIKPCILVEKLLVNENDDVAYDYKFHCLNGRVEYLWVAIDRFGDFKYNCYDRDWNLMERNVNKRGKEIERPELLDEMIIIAERIARDFRYVRVDCYYVRGKIYIGEITLTPSAGMLDFSPVEWDKRLGDKLKL